MMTMTDELVKRWDDYVESMGSVMGEVEHMAQQMRDRIEALTAERDYTEGTNDTLIALNRSLTADNARLKAALTGIKKAAAHRMQNDRRDLHSYYFHTAAAALNTGKEPSHE
jgi:hypothetical protein